MPAPASFRMVAVNYPMETGLTYEQLLANKTFIGKPEHCPGSTKGTN